MNLFKLFIPKEKAQTVTELESWSVEWHVRANGYNSTNRHAKTFIKEEDAQEFQKQLYESAGFIKAWISTELSKN